MACFYVTITENFERFQHLNFETNFLKKKIFFKNWSIFIFFESPKIENATFSYKTATSEANVKGNRMGNGVLPVTTLFF